MNSESWSTDSKTASSAKSLLFSTRGMTLLDRIRDPKRSPAIIAELSGNHNGSYENAEKLLHAAADAGAHSVKLQTYTADSLTLPFDSPDFIVDSELWKGRSLYELYQQACTPYEWHEPLARKAREIGIEIFSTPFDEAAVDFLEESMAPTIYKIASFEITHLPLLERVARAGRPVIMSTGMASEVEIEEALLTLDSNGCSEVILLKCVSAYPSKPEDFNLSSLPAMAERFDRIVGLSDHSPGNEVAIAATTLGARAIEKHFVLDRSSGGIDAEFSIEPSELKNLIRSTAIAHASIGEPMIGPTSQDKSQLKYRRSIYVAEPISKGECFTASNLRIIRPALGLPPKQWPSIIGQKAAADLKPGTPLREQDIDK